MVPHGSNSGSSGNFFSNLQAGNVSGVVTIRRKKRTSALIHHPKKMFEEAQMARRVRAYLTNLVVIGTSTSSSLFIILDCTVYVRC